MKGPANIWTTSQRAPRNQGTNESELGQELEVGGECASGERHGHTIYRISLPTAYPSPRLSDSVSDIVETALGESFMNLIHVCVAKVKWLEKKNPQVV